MGCDGGTIPRRDELVKVKKKPEAKDKDSELAFQWRYCFLTQQLLQSPIVTCGLGHLYNKLSLIEALLNRDTLPDTVKHIKNLKDVKNLNLTPNPEYAATDEKKEGAVDGRAAPYVCPVIGLEMSGKLRFVALWSCGCVFSERALKEIKTDVCHKCQKAFNEEDVVVLNGNDDDQVIMKTRMDARQIKSKKNKERKVKVETITSETSTSNQISIAVRSESSLPSSANVKVITATTSIIKKPEKRPGALVAKKNETKKIKPDYSVAKDPQVSDVYKSLFTTHQSEKDQTRAHWVTYNPFYN